MNSLPWNKYNYWLQFTLDDARWGAGIVGKHYVCMIFEYFSMAFWHEQWFKSHSLLRNKLIDILEPVIPYFKGFLCSSDQRPRAQVQLSLKANSTWKDSGLSRSPTSPCVSAVVVNCSSILKCWGWKMVLSLPLRLSPSLPPAPSRSRPLRFSF